MHRTSRLFVFFLVFALSPVFAQEPPLIRFGRGFAAEEQVWLMSARPDLTPNQGKRYQLKQILFQANPERFQAYLAGELDAGTAPGLAVIFARAHRSVAVLMPTTAMVPPFKSFTARIGPSSFTMYVVLNQSLPAASRQMLATIFMSTPCARAKITARPGAVPASSSPAR